MAHSNHTTIGVLISEFPHAKTVRQQNYPPAPAKPIDGTPNLMQDFAKKLLGGCGACATTQGSAI
jgi:hypothetical protein